MFNTQLAEIKRAINDLNVTVMIVAGNIKPSLQSVFLLALFEIAKEK